jgi:hypothetical protein
MIPPRTPAKHASSSGKERHGFTLLAPDFLLLAAGCSSAFPPTNFPAASAECRRIGVPQCWHRVGWAGHQARGPIRFGPTKLLPLLASCSSLLASQSPGTRPISFQADKFRFTTESRRRGDGRERAGDLLAERGLGGNCCGAFRDQPDNRWRCCGGTVDLEIFGMTGFCGRLWWKPVIGICGILGLGQVCGAGVDTVYSIVNLGGFGGQSQAYALNNVGQSIWVVSVGNPRPML